MNELNSILIEGLVTTLPENIGTTTAPRVRFSLVSRRLTADESGTFTESLLRVTIGASGKLASSCLRNLSVGRRIRVVGHLEGYDDGMDNTLFVKGEHIEYAPFKAPPATV